MKWGPTTNEAGSAAQTHQPETVSMDKQADAPGWLCTDARMPP